MTSTNGLEQLLANPNIQQILRLVQHTEGTEKNGAYTAFGGGRLQNLDAHPGVSTSFTQTDGKKNRTTAAGKYQFLKSTWDGIQKQYDFKDKSFSDHNQDLAAVATIAQAGAVPDILAGNFTGAINKLGKIWVSLPSGTAPQKKFSWDAVNKFLSSTQGNSLMPTAVATTQPTMPAAMPTSAPMPASIAYTGGTVDGKIPYVQTDTHIMLPKTNEEAKMLSDIPLAGLDPNVEAKWAKSIEAINGAQQILNNGGTKSLFAWDDTPGPYDNMLLGMIQKA